MRQVRTSTNFGGNPVYEDLAINSGLPTAEPLQTRFADAWLRYRSRRQV